MLKRGHTVFLLTSTFFEIICIYTRRKPTHWNRPPDRTVSCFWTPRNCIDMLNCCCCIWIWIWICIVCHHVVVPCPPQPSRSQTITWPFLHTIVITRGYGDGEHKRFALQSECIVYFKSWLLWNHLSTSHDDNITQHSVTLLYMYLTYLFRAY